MLMPVNVEARLKSILILWFFEFSCKVDSCQHFSQTFKKYLNEKYLSVLGNLYMFKVSRSLWKNIVLRFMKNIWGVTKKVVWNSIENLTTLPNDNVLEKETENFNWDEVSIGEPLGGDDNGEEEE